MTNPEVIAAGVTAVIGIIFSLAFSYFPGLKTWFAKQTPDMKGLLQLGSITAVVLVEYLLSHAGIIAIFSPGVEGIITAVIVWVLALSGNQGVYLTTKNVGHTP